MSELTIKQQIEELKVKDFFIAALLDATDISQLEAALDALDDIRIMNLAAQRGYKFSKESLRLGLKNIANLIAHEDEVVKVHGRWRIRRRTYNNLVFLNLRYPTDCTEPNLQ